MEQINLVLLLIRTTLKLARLPYWYCSKNVSRYRRHPRSVLLIQQ